MTYYVVFVRNEDKSDWAIFSTTQEVENYLRSSCWTQHFVFESGELWFQDHYTKVLGRVTPTDKVPGVLRTFVSHGTANGTWCVRVGDSIIREGILSEDAARRLANNLEETLMRWLGYES